MNNQPQLQSSLGEVTSIKTSKDRNWNRGYLALGKVVRVHPKRYTADVQIFGTNDLAVSAKDEEGRHACRIGVSNAGYDKLHKKPYGEIIPLQKGSIVLVGYLKNTKEKPVILRVFHDIAENLSESNYKNILNSAYSSDTDDSITRYLKITNIQDFMSVDDLGNFEIASHSKAFLVGKERAMDDENFDFEDLEVKSSDRTTIHVEEQYSKPKKFMAVFRDNFSDNLTNWLKIVVDAAKTSFRVAKLEQTTNRSTTLDITPEGGVYLRRQLDTKAFEGSQQYAEMSISSDGKMQMIFTGATKTTLTINSDGSGVTLETTDDIKVTTDKKIDVQAKQDITINTDQTLNVQAKQDINVKCENATVKCDTSNIDASDSIRVNCPDVTLEGSTTRINSNVKILGNMDMIGQLSVIGTGKINERRIILVGDKDTGKDIQI